MKIIEENKVYGVSFTTDIWSNQVESLISLTAHVVTSGFERQKLILHAQPMTDKRHTGEHINEIFTKMLTSWGINLTDVHLIVRDRGSNMVKGLNDAGVSNLDCVAHQLHLVESTTRWNSTLAMIERIRALKQDLVVYASDENITDWGLNWALLDKMILALKPFLEVTNKSV
uniref:Transposase n=1 Tax=Romanomermis culicivorax TaxID=13658 RepID=A0A915JSB4_ROMCU